MSIGEEGADCLLDDEKVGLALDFMSDDLALGLLGSRRGRICSGGSRKAFASDPR